MLLVAVGAFVATCGPVGARADVCDESSVLLRNLRVARLATGDDSRAPTVR